jgi:hypothetical protein
MNNQFSQRDEEFCQRARAALDGSVENLDGATRSRLNQARQRALESVPTGRWHWLAWLPKQRLWLGAATAFALLLTVGLRTPNAPMPAPSAFSDLEVATSEDAELAEDLAFYEWASIEMANEEQVGVQAG